MSNGWFPYRRDQPGARLRLFCFPFAGGGASFFRAWEPFLNPNIEISAVQLPGREGRFREPFCRNIDELLDALEPEAAGLSTPCALLGYSVGAVFAYALALRMAALGVPPAHLLAIACPGPAFVDRTPLWSSMRDEDFEERVLELNGYAPELMLNRDLLALMIPAMRADIQIMESFHAHQQLSVPCPISALGGQADPVVTYEYMEAWRSVTTADFALRMFPGNHFFVRDYVPETASWIVDQLFSSRAGKTA